MFYEGNDLRDISTFREFQKDYEATIGRRHNFVARSFTRNLLAALGTLAGKAHESAVPRSALWHHGTSSERIYFLERAHEIDATEEAELEHLDATGRLERLRISSPYLRISRCNAKRLLKPSSRAASAITPLLRSRQS